MGGVDRDCTHVLRSSWRFDFWRRSDGSTGMTIEGKATGRKLADFYGIKVKQALYSKGFKGRGWYHTLNEFPAALFDPKGYILFPTKSEYQTFITAGTAKSLFVKSWVSISTDENTPHGDVDHGG
jgi:hypothetical protein